MIEFTKMHGLGNDYIYINRLEGKNQISNISAFTRYISNRHFGVGSDGVILIKESDIADFKMEIYNADGSEAQMCGNGIRCFAKYVYEENIIKKQEFDIETLAGIRHVYLRVRGGEVQDVTVNMGKAVWKDKDLTKIEADDWEIEGTIVSMGNPHFVILTKEVDKIDVKKYGSFIENYPLFPEKTNVEFIEILGNSSIKMRVWERGSGETYACGTGACAAFAVCYYNRIIRDYANVYLKGGPLNIRINRSSGEIFMTGLATKICDGTILDYQV